jgi:hypothetical protein
LYLERPAQDFIQYIQNGFYTYILIFHVTMAGYLGREPLYIRKKAKHHNRKAQQRTVTGDHDRGPIPGLHDIINFSGKHDQVP